jgi:hypothetical protein
MSVSRPTAGLVFSAAWVAALRKPQVTTATNTRPNNTRLLIMKVSFVKLIEKKISIYGICRNI